MFGSVHIQVDSKKVIKWAFVTVNLGKIRITSLCVESFTVAEDCKIIDPCADKNEL